MSSSKNENLESLLQQFMEESQAASMIEDIRYADTTFDGHPAPPIPLETMTGVRQNVKTQLLLKQNRHSRIRWFTVTAATMLVVAGAWFLYNGSSLVKPPSPQSVGHQVRLDSFYMSGLSTADIEYDISDLDQDVKGMDDGPYEPVDTLQLNLNEIENQLIANNTEFWKG